MGSHRYHDVEETLQGQKEMRQLALLLLAFEDQL